ncbi:MAG: urease accessory protein UreF [Pseudomonadota bacterium]
MVTATDQAAMTEAWPSALLTWFSPSFPTGGFAFSQGLETAVSDGTVRDAIAFLSWLETLVVHGSLRNDAIVCARAYQSDAPDERCRLNDLALALQPSAERARETAQLGANFRQAVNTGWPQTQAVFDAFGSDPVSYPVAAGVSARAIHLPIEPTLIAMTNATIANLIAAGIRLSVIGQYDGVRIQARLAVAISGMCQSALEASEEDLASATFAVDIASMRHETEPTRLFQS